MKRPPEILRDDEIRVNVCPRCHGRGWEPDKPWKPGRDWMVCQLCENKAGLTEPTEPPSEDDWARTAER